MSKKVEIRIVRDELYEFYIGDDHEWRLLSDGDGLDGFGEVNNTITIIDNATLDGGTLSGQHIKSVDRTIKCAYVYLKDNESARKNALLFFKPKSSYKMYITFAGQTRWAECNLYKFNLPNTNTTDLMKMTLTFMFPNPFFKSVDDFGKDIAEVTAMFGFPWLINGSGGKSGKGVVTGIYNFDKVVTIQNDGDIDTTIKAIIKANGAVVNPSLIVNGEYVRIIDNLVKDDSIEIDFTVLPPKVRKNGSNFIGHCDRTSAFNSMGLVVGTNIVQYNAEDGSDKMSVSIFYSKMYGAI